MYKFSRNIAKKSYKGKKNMKLPEKTIQKIRQYLHTRKAQLDPITRYLLTLNKDYLYYYLWLHPQAIQDPTTRQQILQYYLKGNTFRRETLDYYHDKHSPTLDYNLRNLIRDNTNYNIEKHGNNQRRTNNIQINLDKQNLRNNIYQDLLDKYRQLHHDTMDNVIKDAPTPENPIDDEKQSDTKKKIDDILKKHREKMDKRHKKIQKDAENKIKWRTELTKDPSERKKYKIWIQHPNPKTRHTITNGQKVPLEEKFEVINDRTGQIDFLDHPGDGKGSIGNIANCYCTMEFTDDDSNLYNPDKYSVTDAYEELVEKTEKLEKMLSKKAIKLTNDATLLGSKEDIPWIITSLKLGYKQHRRMRITDLNKALEKRDGLLTNGYLKSDFNLEIAHGKIWLEHTTLSRDSLKLDSLTKNTNSHSYNTIAELLRGRAIDITSYSPEERNALDFYSRDEFYSTFNSWQRSNFSDEIIESAVNNEQSLLYGRDKTEINELFRKNYDVLKQMQIELNEDMIMYHGQRRLYDSDGEELKEIGEWDNTISLGLFRQSGEKYATDDDGNKNILYRIYVPKGTKITPILQMSQPDYIDESEVLLGKGHKYKVDHYYIEDGFSIRDSRLL
ncbi:MAG: hypothetical protein BZ136_08490 [Methanosphaera sp. rholeuAM74]|nr:MAG: hypothetical protein BZ136_08490 [Methanosphaera sp. rholeuAM74]